jgi:NADH-quinone oxidoreductase subunit L
VIATIGAATAFFAATVAIVQTDIKKVLAYSTISQLGFMFVALGVGAYGVAVFHLYTHAFFKACLFLGAGSVIHALGGEQDLRRMGGLARRLPVTFATFAVSTAAIAGLPPLAGFWSKDEILYGAFAGGQYGVWMLGAGGAFLTGFYMLRCYYLAFEGPSRVEALAAHRVHESPAVMTVPLAILAFFVVVVGFVGVPPEHGAYHRFVESVLAAAGGAAQHAAPVGEWPMAAVSVLIAGAGIGLATRCYLWRPGEPERWAARCPRLYRWLLNKYYVDEAYDTLLVEPIRRGAVWLWRRFDEPIVDGSVNGIGALVRTGGRLLRYLQTGYVTSYVLSFILGVVAILGYLAFWR